MQLPTSNLELPTNKGQALILSALFFMAISITVGLGVVHPVINQIESARAELSGAQSLYAAEAVSQDVIYRLIKGMSVDTVETLSVGTATGAATTTDILDGKEVVSSGDQARYVRKNKMTLLAGSGVSFNYGLQAGDGGINLTNSALIVGNVYSNGPITGSNNNLVRGTAVSAGPSGLIDGVHATSSAYAHTIRNADIDGDAYYQTISGSSVAGALHPGSPDQATSTLPIPDSLISDWETEAAAGGSVTCSGGAYNVSGSVTLGPKKIPCNFYIDGSDKLYLTGPLWVTGNIQFSNSSKVEVHSSLAGKTVAIVADNPSNQTSSSKIFVSNSTEFLGAGADSYVLLISQNKSAEQGGGDQAISISNSVNGKVLVYAGRGRIDISNSVSLKEVTAYRINVSNNAVVTYETGLANLLFTAGPSGGYHVDSWREVE
jgi:hypothetical protein